MLMFIIAVMIAIIVINIAIVVILVVIIVLTITSIVISMLLTSWTGGFSELCSWGFGVSIFAGSGIGV